MSAVNRRWLVAVATCCALAALLILPASVQTVTCTMGVCDNGQYQGARIQLAASRQHAEALTTQLREAAALSLAARVLPRAAAVGEPIVWFAPDVPGRVRQSFVAALDSERAARKPWAGRGRVAVLVVTDTARSINGVRLAYGPVGRMATRALLPSPNTGNRCVTVVYLRSLALRNGVNHDRSRPLLDACAFFDAFGTPGPNIAASLDSGRYDGARIYTPGATDSLRRRYARGSLLGWSLAHWPNAAGCAAGSDERCEALIRARLVETRFGYRYPATAAVQRLPVTTEWSDGRNGSALLDVVAADIGPERFARLWTSNATFVDAYREVTGRSIANLVRPVAAQLFEPAGRRTGFGARATIDTSRTIGSGVLVIATIALLAMCAERLARRPRPT